MRKAAALFSPQMQDAYITWLKLETMKFLYFFLFNSKQEGKVAPIYFMQMRLCFLFLKFISRCVLWPLVLPRNIENQSSNTQSNSIPVLNSTWWVESAFRSTSLIRRQ